MNKLQIQRLKASWFWLKYIIWSLAVRGSTTSTGLVAGLAKCDSSVLLFLYVIADRFVKIYGFVDDTIIVA